MYEYAAKLESVHDGDTLRCVVDLGFGLAIKQDLRLYGLDCPELATPAGKAAFAFTQQAFADHGQAFTVRTIKDRTEKYGRLLATVTFPDGTILNAELLKAGHAVQYFGGKR